jgi:hypothetical protein
MLLPEATSQGAPQKKHKAALMQGAPWPSFLCMPKKLAGFSGALSSGQRYAKLI